MPKHLIDENRYRPMLFARSMPAWPVGDSISTIPYAASVQHIQAREIPLTARTGHTAFVRAFEVLGPLLFDLRTSLIQLGMIWASSPPIDERDWRFRAMGRLYQGYPASPQTILELSQTAIAHHSSWRWAVSAPRGTEFPFPLDDMGQIPLMYMSDHETYPDAGAAFDALMRQVVDGWTTGFHGCPQKQEEPPSPPKRGRGRRSDVSDEAGIRRC